MVPCVYSDGVYSDGVVTLRPLHPDDLELHLQAVDDEQIAWLWEPGDGARYAAKTSEEQRAGHLRYLQAMHDCFGPGPKWAFSVDAVEAHYVVYVDCDLANPHVPAGEANISYACHPQHRGKGYTSRAVRLVCEFLREHTTAREAHLVVDAANIKSLRVAHAVGAAQRCSFRNEHGRTMIRHVIDLRPAAGGLD
ncbi:MAG: GNAT family N-acetyltransferase [Mycobacteriales bacterium]